MSLRVALLLFLAAFVAFALARLPLSVVLDLAGPPGLRAGEVTGTVWDGRVLAATLGGRPVGDIGLRFHGTGWTWRLDGPGLSGDGVLVPGFGDVSLGAVRLSGDLRRLAPMLPVEGRFDLADGAISLADGACVTAAGRATAMLDLPEAAGGSARLDGPLDCRDGTLHLRLAGMAADGPFSAAVAFDPAAAGRPGIIVDQAGPTLSRLLQAAGFQPQGTGLALMPAAGSPGGAGS